MGEEKVRTAQFSLGSPDESVDVEESLTETADMTSTSGKPPLINTKLAGGKLPSTSILKRHQSDVEPVMATMIKFNTPDPNGSDQFQTDKFGVMRDFSVVTQRLIGQRIQNKMVDTAAIHNLQGCLKRSNTEPTLEIPHDLVDKSKVDAVKPHKKPFKMPPPPGSKPPGFGDSGYGDRYTTQWDWPYPIKPIVKSTDDKFEAVIFYAPFKHDEVWARVMGTDLMITCIPKDEDDEATIARFGGKPRHFSRTYQLPLNTDPRSVIFRLLKKANQLKIVAQRLPPIKMAVAAYGSKAAAEEIIQKKGIDEKQLAIEAFNHLRDLHIEGPVLNHDSTDTVE